MSEFRIWSSPSTRKTALKIECSKWILELSITSDEQRGCDGGRPAAWLLRKRNSATLRESRRRPDVAVLPLDRNGFGGICPSGYGTGSVARDHNAGFLVRSDQERVQVNRIRRRRGDVGQLCPGVERCEHRAGRLCGYPLHQRQRFPLRGGRGDHH